MVGGGGADVGGGGGVVGGGLGGATAGVGGLFAAWFCGDGYCTQVRTTSPCGGCRSLFFASAKKSDRQHPHAGGGRAIAGAAGRRVGGMVSGSGGMLRYGVYVIVIVRFIGVVCRCLCGSAGC